MTNATTIAALGIGALGLSEATGATDFTPIGSGENLDEPTPDGTPKVIPDLGDVATLIKATSPGRGDPGRTDPGPDTGELAALAASLNQSNSPIPIPTPTGSNTPNIDLPKLPGPGDLPGTGGQNDGGNNPVVPTGDLVQDEITGRVTGDGPESPQNEADAIAEFSSGSGKGESIGERISDAAKSAKDAAKSVSQDAEDAVTPDSPIGKIADTVDNKVDPNNSGEQGGEKNQNLLETAGGTVQDNPIATLGAAGAAASVPLTGGLSTIPLGIAGAGTAGEILTDTATDSKPLGQSPSNAAQDVADNARELRDSFVEGYKEATGFLGRPDKNSDNKSNDPSPSSDPGNEDSAPARPSGASRARSSSGGGGGGGSSGSSGRGGGGGSSATRDPGEADRIARNAGGGRGGGGDGSSGSSSSDTNDVDPSNNTVLVPSDIQTPGGFTGL